MQHRLVLVSIFVLASSLLACGDADKAPQGKSVSASSPPASAAPERMTPASPAPVAAPVEMSRAYFGALSTDRLTASLDMAPAAKGRSMVLIVMDALNVRHLSLYGYERNTSPHIDGLAKDGIFFTNHVSNSSWTRPSYTTIMTGLPKSEHGVELGSNTVGKDITTLAERFASAGYKTAGIVGNPLVRDIWGYAQGFQTYQDTHTFGKAFPWDGALIDAAIRWLETTGDKPFFLALFLTAPHAPYRPPRQARHFLKTVPEGRILEYPFREYKRPLDKGDHDRMVAAYDDEIGYMDRKIGELVAHLKESGRFDDTVMMLTADHGEVFGTHNCYTHAYHMWEPALRVPLVIRAPDMSIRGVYDDRPFTHVDLAPTALDLVGLQGQKSSLEGLSLVSVLKDPARGRSRVRFSQYNAHSIRRQAIRDDRYKLIHYHEIEPSALKKLNSLHGSIPTADPKDLPTLVASLEGERYELYDLVADPNERTDRFDELKSDKAVSILRKALNMHLNEKEDKGAMSKELIEALKNAGYFVSGGEEKKTKDNDK